MRFFGVQLLASLDLPGIPNADEQIHAQSRKDAVEAALPLCVFLIGVRKPEGLYRWAMDPVIAGGQAVLHRAAKPTWQVLDETGIVGR